MAQQPQATIGAHWSTNTEFYRGQNGRRLTFICPGGGSASNVWGSEFYTDDSSVCSAAVHAGVIGFDGGAITVTVEPGRASYQGTGRNGVTSYDYGAHAGSFTVSAVTADGQVDWKTTARGLAMLPIKRLTVICPPGGSSGPVWGSAIYTENSSICAAAVHAGVITFDGGRVTLQPAGEQSVFPASTQRGVTTAAYGKYPASFRVEGGQLAHAIQPETTPGAPNAPVSKASTARGLKPKPPESKPPAPAAPGNSATAAAVRRVTTNPLQIAGTSTSAVRIVKTVAVQLAGQTQTVTRLVKTVPIVISGKP